MPRTLVFDLDGTLVDTAPDLISALNFVLEREGLAPLPMHRARNMIGAGARKMLERGLEAEGRVVSTGELDRLTKDFIGYYADHIADASRPFEGLEAALDELQGQGFQFAVCTNKLEWLSKRLLDQLGMTARFKAICGADTFGVAKPDPVILQQTLVRERRASCLRHHGRRRRPRRRRRPAGRRSRDRGRVRLHRRSDRRIEAGPADRALSRPVRSGR